MKYTTLLLVFLLSLVAAEKYAMVFGTADGWGNYSITSEPCRVYDDLIKAGIKPENIIFMAYTSNLKSQYNPWPEKIFTDPAENLDGDWAKYGCFEHVDYTDKDITEAVFIAILSGNKEGVEELTHKKNPKVLNAGPDDTVFTYFIDHGTDDMIMVGDQPVTSHSLMYALKTAHEDKIYGKWLWFMEACHSGSMFKTLPEDWNIYVMTSADADHNALMTNCPPNDYVNGKELETCMAGLWDNRFLEYVEQHPDCTIGEIVDTVTKQVAEVSEQGVSEFGDKSFRDMKFSDFFGTLPSSSFRKNEKKSIASLVSVDEVPKHLAMWKAIRADKSELKNALKAYQEEVFKMAKQEVEVMRLGRSLMNEKAADKALKAPAEIYSSDCVRQMTMNLAQRCGHSLPLSSKASNMIRNICLPGLTVPNVNWNDICM